MGEDATTGSGTYRRAAGLVLLAVSVLALLGWNHHRSDVDLGGVAFSSMEWHVRLAYLPPGKSRDEVQGALQQQIDAVDAALSSWRADSELSSFNHTTTGQWVQTSPLFYRSVGTALQVSDISGGAFDITVAPLVNLWGFGPHGRPDRIPSDAQVAALRNTIGWRHVHLSTDQHGDTAPVYVMRDSPVQLDLSSLGEGAAVDGMRHWLEQAGVHDYMVSVAGNVVVKGRRADGAEWQIAIEKPDASGMAQKVLRISNHALASSGTYRNYYEKNGRHYSHIINPVTGKPVTHNLVSVTVVSPWSTDHDTGLDGTLVDGLSTALNVLGPDAGYALAEREHIAAFFVVKTDTGFAEKYTQAFAAYIAN